MSQWDYRGVTPGMDLISGRHAVRVRQTHDTHTHRWLISEVRATPRLRLQTQFALSRMHFHTNTQTAAVSGSHTRSLDRRLETFHSLYMRQWRRCRAPETPGIAQGLGCSVLSLRSPPLLFSQVLIFTIHPLAHMQALSHTHTV